MTDTVYTIGHSTHSIGRFVELLRQHSVTAVCDVRSRPYSRVNPQFNRETLKEALANASIKYVFLGEELGARTDDRSCYCNGKVQYDLLAKTDLFKKGIDRVKKGAHEYRLALMCAEKEPLDCHRTILVSRILSEGGMTIRHILADGRIEEHSHALKRLIGMLRVPSSDMFRSEEAVIKDAYAKQGQQIAYQAEPIDGAPHVDQIRYDVPGGAE
jgi:uncharacterized protein (DUF488 family)